MQSSGGFTPVEPFGIDEGELDGLTPQQCFTLGVEWQMVVQLADQPAAFARPVHADNHNRIAALLEKLGRQFSMKFMPDDVSESWLWLEVQDAE